MNEKEQKETKAEEERIRENGQVTLEENGKRIHLLSIIGEIEGHDNLSGSTKTTKYEHILPELAKVESDEKIGGVLILVNTIGGDVSCGLALAEMIACISSLRKSRFRLIRSIRCICSATNCSPFFVFRILVLDCCLASVNPYLTSDSGRSWCSKIYASAARNGSLI